ncbi:MAG: DUF3325 domain-containing protein [Burkholderiaceae bacterium]
MHALTLLTAVPAFALLALAMERHQVDLYGREWPASRSRLARGAGFALLAVSLAIAVRTQGWSLGLVAWCGHLSAAAALVAVVLIAIERRKPARRR